MVDCLLNKNLKADI